MNSGTRMTVRKVPLQMGNIRRCLLLFVLVMVPNIAALSQGVPAVAAYSLTAHDGGESVSRIVNDLVFSFVREQRNYRIIDLRNEPLPSDLAVPDGADYIFYGNLSSQPGGIKLELILRGGPKDVTRLISRVFENYNRILLDSRLLVSALFDQSQALPDPEVLTEPESPPVPAAPGPGDLLPVRDMDSLAGAWSGEAGVEKVVILRGGRGVVYLASGVSLFLELTLSGDELVVRQKGSPSPRQFMDLPDPVAKQAADIVPALEWRFRISSDRKRLSGIKKTVTIRHDGQNIISMENLVLATDWLRN